MNDEQDNDSIYTQMDDCAAAELEVIQNMGIELEQERKSLSLAEKQLAETKRLYQFAGGAEREGYAQILKQQVEKCHELRNRVCLLEEAMAKGVYR